MAKPVRTRSRAPRRKSGGSFLLGMFFGLVLGLGIALGVAFYLNRAQIPFLEKSKSGSRAETPTTPGTQAAPGAGLPQGGTSGEKPKFDFYKILPGSGEAPVTGAAPNPAGAQPGSAAAPKPATGAVVYYIQTGAFQKSSEADNQKARLALLGFDSDIQQVRVPDKGTWYRVRIGPYTHIDEINHVRQELAKNGFNPSLVKAKGGSAN